MSRFNQVSETFGQAWYNLVDHLVYEGKVTCPRGLETRETTAVSLTVTNALQNVLVDPTRNLNYRFMVAEWLWITAGRADVASIAAFNKEVAKFSDDGITFAGAYGPRLLPQWPWLLSLLRREPDTRQAAATIFTPTPASSRDVPCTLSLQLLRRDARLHAIVTMRSSDVWLGIPYDFFNFSMLLASCAAALEIDVGALTFNLGSSHLYAANLDAAREVLRRQETTTLPSPRLSRYVTATAAEVTLLDVDLVNGLSAERLPVYYDALHVAKTRREALEVLRHAAK